MKKMFSTLLTKILLAVSPLFVSSIAQAASYPDFREPFDFSLLFSNSRIDLQAGRNQHRISLDRISIAVLTRIESQVQFGFIAGSSNLSINDDPASAGLSLSGYHAGLTMRSALGNNPKLTFHTNYIYQGTKDETSSQIATLGWHEWEAGISGKLRLGQRLEIGIGWTYLGVDAQRRATGDINETRGFKLTSGTQQQLDIAWLANSDGRVALMVQRGRYQRVEFRFSQKFR